ncbi:hypothetical protein IWZ00DRAFT_495902 [Phyllosticta capitalensis]|uniref:Protoporphyrinogen oxidase n=1 Tax=Phyllosticta capitalensis TaxID=121624 RepID=A0ABR1Z3J6_9PEZI
MLNSSTLSRRTWSTLPLHVHEPVHYQRRHCTTNETRAESTVRSIAVLGGGITGLATALFANQKFPGAKISLFEASDRVGGVIESLKINASGGREIICETGPRTLRANTPRAIVTIDLINSLRKHLPLSSLLFTPRTSPTACSRYIFHPPSPVPLPPADMMYSISEQPVFHPQTVATMVQSAHSILTHPFFHGVLSGIWRDTFLARRPPHVAEAGDESIRSFTSRRFGQSVADNVISPLIAHGLHAGDAERLSARTLLPGMWDAETKAEERGNCGGVVGQILVDALSRPWATGTNAGNQNNSSRDRSAATHDSTRRENELLESLRRGPAGALEKLLFKDVAWFSFRRGVAELLAALEAMLKENPRSISIEKNARIKTVSRAHDGSMAITIQSSSTVQTRNFTHVIAATSLNSLLSIAASPEPALRDKNTFQETSSVMIVTVFYARPFANHPYRGFGYLIPPNVAHCWNPEQALAVVFDSDAIDGQDEGPRGTKISVILGGHYWFSLSQHLRAKNRAGSYPSQDAAVSMAKRLLARHIGLVEEPMLAIATLQQDALPQYTVGHHARMAQIHDWLLDKYSGRVRVAGNSYGGIGIHDCIFSARSVVERLAMENETGLERLVDGEMQRE